MKDRIWRHLNGDESKLVLAPTTDRYPSPWYPPDRFPWDEVVAIAVTPKGGGVYEIRGLQDMLAATQERLSSHDLVPAKVEAFSADNSKLYLGKLHFCQSIPNRMGKSPDGFRRRIIVRFCPNVVIGMNLGYQHGVPHEVLARYRTGSVDV